VLAVPKWKPETVVWLVLGVFVFVGVGSLLGMLLRGDAAPESAPSVLRILVSAATFQIGALALTWRFLIKNETDWASGFGLRVQAGKAIWLGALAVLLFLPVGWSLQMLCVKVLQTMGIEPAEQLALVALRNSGSAAQIIALGIVTIILAPVAEEILFRGVLYSAIAQYGHRQIGVWMSSVIFALIHANVAIFIPLLALALLLVWLYERTGNLLAPITAHAVFNAINFIMFFIVDPRRSPTEI